MECSIVIPAYNEANRISGTIGRIDRYLREHRWRYEIIVVDDGSTDDTVNVVRRLGRHIRLETLPANRGKGAAVNRGFMVSRFPWVLFSDADLSTPIEDIERFLPHLHDAPVIIGSRNLPGSQVEVHQAKVKELLGRFGNTMVQLLLVPGIRDTQCGFKLFSRAACAPIFAAQRTWRFGFDFELLFLARKANLRIHEVPVHWRNDTRSTVTWIDYLRTLTELIRIRWNDVRNRYPLWQGNQSSNGKTSS